MTLNTINIIHLIVIFIAIIGIISASIEAYRNAKKINDED